MATNNNGSSNNGTASNNGTTSLCGNSKIEEDETCETCETGQALSCPEDKRFGTATCTDDCQIDESGCSVGWVQVSVNPSDANFCVRDNNGTISCAKNFSDFEEGSIGSPSGVFAKVEVGLSHSCGLSGDSILCWEGVEVGSLITIAGAFSDFSVGDNAVCGIDRDKKIKCFDPNNPNTELETKFDDELTFTKLRAGKDLVCGFLGDRTVRCSNLAGNGTGHASTGDTEQFEHFELFGRFECSSKVRWTVIKFQTLLQATFLKCPMAGGVCWVSSGVVSCVDSQGDAVPIEEPNQKFEQVSVGGTRVGIKTDGTLHFLGSQN